MKRIATAILTAIFLFALFGCGEKGVEKSETNLEFWICDNADELDFSNCKERFGIMGGREYYGSAYAPTEDENGEQTDPEKCVIYTVTSYPDYSDKAKHITRITITDPAVNVFGLTVKSTEDEIKTTMDDHGYSLTKSENSYGLSFRKGKISFRFYDNCIQIAADVSNKSHIMF